LEAVFTADHWADTDKQNSTGKYTDYNLEKQTMQNTAKQNYPSSVAFCDTRPGNEVPLKLNGGPQILKNCQVCYNCIILLPN